MSSPSGHLQWKILKSRRWGG